MDGKSMPQLGSVISLISKAGLRYVGQLIAVDPEGNTITLNNVKSFGTENRAGPFSVVPQAQNLFAKMMFRVSDVVEVSCVGGSHPLPYGPAFFGVQNTGEQRMPIDPIVNMNAARSPAMNGTGYGLRKEGVFGIDGVGPTLLSPPPNYVKDSFLMGYQQQRLPPMRHDDLHEQQGAQVSVVDFGISSDRAMPVSRTRPKVLPPPPGFEKDFFRVNSMQPLQPPPGFENDFFRVNAMQMRRDETSQKNKEHREQSDASDIPNCDMIAFGDFRPIPLSASSALERNNLFAVRGARHTKQAPEEQQQQTLRNRENCSIKVEQQQQLNEDSSFVACPKTFTEREKPKQTAGNGTAGKIKSWRGASFDIYGSNKNAADNNDQLSRPGHDGEKNENGEAGSGFKIDYWNKFHFFKQRNDELRKQVCYSYASTRSNQSMAKCSRGRKPTQDSLIYEPTGVPADFVSPRKGSSEFRNDFDFTKGNEEFEQIRASLFKLDMKDKATEPSFGPSSRCQMKKPALNTSQPADEVAVDWRNWQPLFDNSPCKSKQQNITPSKNYTLYGAKLNAETFGLATRRGRQSLDMENKNCGRGEKTDRKPQDSRGNADDYANASGKGAVPKQTRQHRR